LKINLWPQTSVSEAKRINAMATEEEEILTFNFSDEALEIAGAMGDRANFTFGVCTFEQPGCPPSIVPAPGLVRPRNDMRA